MPASKLAAYVHVTRRYLDSPHGRINSANLMQALGWSYERVVAEAVMYCCRLVVYERIAEVTERVMREELEVFA